MPRAPDVISPTELPPGHPDRVAAEAVARYWARQGQPVQVALKRLPVVTSGKREFLHQIVSTLIDALPPGYRGPMNSASPVHARRPA